IPIKCQSFMLRSKMGTQGLVWQKRGLNPPLGFITANLMIGDERSSRVSIVLFFVQAVIFMLIKVGLNTLMARFDSVHQHCPK
ncbi:hypothetical protein DKZ27_11625, partial [Limosilactobacillus reuteri]